MIDVELDRAGFELVAVYDRLDMFCSIVVEEACTIVDIVTELVMTASDRELVVKVVVLDKYSVVVEKIVTVVHDVDC